MIDTNIINDADLMEKAKKVKRAKRNEYNKKWYRDFKEKHGVDYHTYLEAKHLKERENE